jgi:hypothetical protein
MKNYLVLYNPGMCGTWLTWLISQHKNFPQYNHKVKEYINDKKETKLLDWDCYGSDWYTYKYISKDSDYYLKNNPSDAVKSSEILSHTFEENRRTRSFTKNTHPPYDNVDYERNNKSFTKDCVKILPNHGCSNDSKWEDKLETVNKELLKNITDDMQPEKIIVPVFNSSNDILIKRWIIYLAYHNKLKQNYIDELSYWRKKWSESSDWIIQDNSYGNNVHYVDIEKLISGDNDEYLKLCEAINETPINKIQDQITLYRNAMLEVVAHYDRIT